MTLATLAAAGALNAQQKIGVSVGAGGAWIDGVGTVFKLAGAP